jgi:hypothetical protein
MKIDEKINKKVANFSFFGANSVGMIFGVNLSFFFFLPLLKQRIIFTQLTKNLNLGSFYVLCFMIGATFSTFQGFFYAQDAALFNHSIAVYPNYLFWCFMLLVLMYYGRNYIFNYNQIFGKITIATILLILYYIFLQDSIGDNVFLKTFQKNNIAFCLICFTPYVVYFSKKKYGLFWALVLFFLILAFQLQEERRAGFVIVFLGGFFSLVADKLNHLNLKTIIFTLVVFGIFVLLLNSNLVKQGILSSSPRIHDLIYKSENLVEDRSALMRLAMVEKGLSLFNKNILFGVGLNNFIFVEGEITGNFEGSEFVISKEVAQRTSSHNSYINILAEGGLFLMLPFILLLLFFIKNLIVFFFKFNSYEKVISISFFSMIIHFYFMTAIVNSLAWFNLALVSYIIVNNQVKMSLAVGKRTVITTN